MTDLLDELGEICETSTPTPEKILKSAAYLHARFEYNHPFADGNGRVGRTLVNYYLMINGHPPLIIYEEDRHLYCDSLRTYDEKEDIGPLSAFFLYETEKAWTKALVRECGTKPSRTKNLGDCIR